MMSLYQGGLDIDTIKAQKAIKIDLSLCVKNFHTINKREVDIYEPEEFCY